MYLKVLEPSCLDLYTYLQRLPILWIPFFQDFDSYLPWMSSSCTIVLLMSVPRLGTLCVLPCQNNRWAVMGWLIVCKILLMWKNHLILQWLKLGKTQRSWYWLIFSLFFLFFCYKTFFFITVYQCTIRTTFIFAYLLIVRSNCQCLLDQRKSKRVPEKHLLLLYWLCQSLWLCGSQHTVENS